MRFKPKECQGCVLYNSQLETAHEAKFNKYNELKAGRGFVLPEGNGKNGVIVISDYPEDREILDGLPLRPSSPNGSVFERVVKRTPGLKREEFKIGHTISCQPPFNMLYNAPWQKESIDHCSIHRDKLINSIPMKGLGYRQRVILALGDISFRTLTGLDGEYLNLDAIRGYPIETDFGIVIGSYSPYKIVQGGQKLMGVLMLDVRKALEIAKNGFNKKPLMYNENPTIEECREFLEDLKNNPDKTIAFDIETPFVEDKKLPDTIYSIQFSTEQQTGIFFNWIGLEEEIAREILALPNPKIGYNSWRFDGPVLESVGCKIGGRHDDVLWCFHHYQPDLTIESKEEGDASISSRMGLQYVASFFDMDFHWKYMKKFKEMQKFYGMADVDALQRIWLTLPQQMSKLGVWRGYEGVRYKLEPVLINMSDRGIPVDEVNRSQLREVILKDKEENFDYIQTLVPEELRNVSPKEGYKKGWKAVKVKEGKIRVTEEDTSRIS